jgi:hypothetical protein
LFAPSSQFAPVVLAVSLICWALAVFPLLRFGLLAFVVQGFFDNLLESYPLATQGRLGMQGSDLYLPRNAAEKGELLKSVLLNCATDGVSLTPT